ncbi:ABC transporter ATP-binding protein [Paenibacillus sp. FSL K6-1096]|uniref:ABC transporter ATP-binding protein n=1 Tax=Paenibacillus sp. FSL K6-1096 TaxID=2921460 RepID=UPI0030ECB284
MPLLEVTDLRKTYGGQPSVDGISFSVEAGRCVALLGPNGAGKTTTLRMLAGLLPQTSGTVSFGGGTPGEDYRRYLGYLPQAPAFYNWMSGLEYLRFSAKLSGMSSREAAAASAAVLERVGLTAAARRRIGGYSGGMKQRLGLAQALVHRPRLLLLDEPVSALDPIGRREVMELLREIREETTVILSTHVLHDAEEMCDEVILMNRGRIAEQGTLARLRAEYSLPVIRLATVKEDRAVRWLEELGNRAFVEAAEVSDGKALLNVSDIELARRTILLEAAELDIPLLQFEAGSSTLEELFMKVVGA